MKKMIWSLVLTIGIVGFFGPFVIMGFGIDYDALIGNDSLAFLTCIISMLAIIGSCIVLYRSSEKFKKVLQVIGGCVLWWI